MELIELSGLSKSFSECIVLPVRCFYSNFYGYNIYTICCSSDTDILDQICKLLTECISIDLQSHLESVYERYNIYLLLFSENADVEQRIRIEQDKYCCRKIVLPERMPEDISTLCQRIEKRLFQIDIPPEPLPIPKSLSELLAEYDDRLPAFIQEIPPQIKKDIESEAIKIFLLED